MQFFFNENQIFSSGDHFPQLWDRVRGDLLFLQQVPGTALGTAQKYLLTLTITEFNITVYFYLIFSRENLM